jgi:KDO2-lipid IV(A) lauroyltransferase
MHEPQSSFPWQNYLAPKFWHSWLGLAGMRMLTILPYRPAMMIGKLIGHLFYRIARYRREIVQTNIALCFPELSAAEQENLVKAHFHSLGMTITETALTCWGSEAKIRKLSRIINFHHAEEALQAGTGAILLGAHYTTVDISGRILTMDHKLSCSYQALRNPLMNEVIFRARQRIMDRLFSRDEIRQTFRFIKQNNLVWIAADQDSGIKNSVFAPFFGHTAATQTVTSRIARVTRAPIIPYVSRRLKNYQGYELEFYPPLENFPGDSLEEDAARTNKILEDFVREMPEQYLWVHRRFKTRPEGMPKLYRKKPRRVKHR